MADANLVLQVDSKGVDSSTNKLKKLTREGKKTEAQVHKLQTGFKGFGKNASAAIAAIDGPMGGISSRVSAFTTVATAGGVAVTALAIGVAGLGVAIGQGVSELDDLNLRLAKTEALLKATGNASGFTAIELRKNAEAVAFATLASVEGIEDAQSRLLTFDRIQTETLKRAVVLSQDLATVFGGTAASQATQLGKALQDPVKGISALNRVGVSFSATQKEQIKLFTETGEVAKAQELILKSLASQVGGAGAAVAKDSLAGAADTAGQNWDKFTSLLADKTGSLSLAQRVMRGLNKELSRFNEALAPDTPTDLFDKALEASMELSEAQAYLNSISRKGSREYQYQAEQVRYLQGVYDDLRASASSAASTQNTEIEKTTKALEAAAAARKRQQEEDAAARASAASKKASEIAVKEAKQYADLVAAEKLRYFKDAQEQEEANFQEAQSRRLSQGEARYNAEIITLERIRSAREQDLQNQSEYVESQGRLAAASAGLFGSIADAIKASGDDSSEAYKTAFALSKGFVVAQSSLNAGLAVSQALALPSDVSLAQKFASYAAVATAVGGVVSSIASIDYSGGRMQGGAVNAGQSYNFLEKGEPELFIPNSAGVVKTMDQISGGGGDTNITIVNQTTGRIDRVDQRQISRGEIELIIKEVVPAEINDTNSGTSKALQSQTTSNRVLR